MIKLRFNDNLLLASSGKQRYERLSLKRLQAHKEGGRDASLLEGQFGL